MAQAARATHYSKGRNTRLSKKTVTSPNARFIMPYRFPMRNPHARILIVASSLNEIIRADMIHDKALTYWYEINVPEPPPSFPKPATQISHETLAQRLGLPSDDEASATTSDSTPDSPIYSPTSYSSQPSA
jgi:hypothetical protein